jgi:hypothetical protein
MRASAYGQPNQVPGVLAAAGKFISAASLGQCRLARSGSPAAPCRNDGAEMSRSWIAFSQHCAATSMSPQIV